MSDFAANMQKVRELFDAVVELPLEQQQSELSKATASPEVIREVASLLKSANATRTSSVTRAMRPIGSLLAQAEPPRLELGERLGAWQVEKLIAEGGMGKVYRAKRADGHFEQTAAIKVMSGIVTSLALERLTQERQILAKLTHSNIARLLDGGATLSGHPYIVMEYIDGPDIETYCKEQELSTSAVLSLFDAVLDAIAFAHRQLVIHCDLKPSNILVASGGRAVVLDFGIANLLGDGKGDSRGKVYTPEYSSPEQRSGSPLSTATDTYSLALVLRRLLPGPISREMKAILEKATSEVASSRYPSVEAFKEDLWLFRGNLPLKAIPNTIQYRAQKFAKRRWPWLAVASASFSTISLLGIQVMQERDTAIQAQYEANTQRDAAIVAQREARDAAESAQQERRSAQVSELAARSSEKRALQAESIATTNEKQAEVARKRAEEEASVSGAKSHFFSQVFSSYDSAAWLNASSTVKDLLDVAKRNLLAGGYYGANLDAKQSVAEMLAAAYENIGQRQERKFFTKLRLDSLVEMQAKQVGDAKTVNRSLATTYLDLMTIAGDEGNVAEQRAWAEKYLKVAGRIEEGDWAPRRITGHAFALQAFSSNQSIESTVIELEKLVNIASAIRQDNERKSVLSILHNLIAQVYAGGNDWERAIKSNGVALSLFPKSHAGASVKGSLTSLMLERLVYLQYSGRIEDGLSFYPQLDEVLREKEPEGGAITAMAGTSYVSMLLTRGDFAGAEAMQIKYHPMIEKYFGPDSPRAFDALLLRLWAQCRAGRFNDVVVAARLLMDRSAGVLQEMPFGMRLRYEALLGFAEFHSGETEAGLLRLSRANSDRKFVNPSDYWSLAFQIDMLLDSGNTGLAEKYVDQFNLESFAKSNRFPAVSAELNFSLARIRLLKGDALSAAELFSKAEAYIEHQAGRNAVVSVLSRTRRALAVLQQGDWSQAASLRDEMLNGLAASGQAPGVGDWRWAQLKRKLAVN